MDWGKRIKSLRVTHGLTQKELAWQLGVDTTTVSRWERNLVEPQPQIRRTIERDFELRFMSMDSLRSILDMQSNGGSIIDYQTKKFLYSNAPAKEAFLGLGLSQIEGMNERDVFLTMPGNEGNSSGVDSYSEIYEKLGGTYLHDGGVVQVTVTKFRSDQGEVLLARAERVVLGHDPYKIDGR
ncbi:MAG: multiprotein-bridging factor 1 family protein [Paracoccaceae bacterium]